MRRTTSLVCGVCVLAIGVTLAQEPKSARPRVTVGQIQAGDVIGGLGVPLGKCVPIRATVVRSESNTKAAQGRFFLKVTRVNNQDVPKPFEMNFGVHQFATERVKLASGDFELYELRMGKKAGSLSGEQVKELEKGYVGTVYDLIVYETGGFRGIPNDLPKDVQIWQDFGYHFMTTLIVMDQK